METSRGTFGRMIVLAGAVLGAVGVLYLGARLGSEDREPSGRGGGGAVRGRVDAPEPGVSERTDEGRDAASSLPVAEPVRADRRVVESAAEPARVVADGLPESARLQACLRSFLGEEPDLLGWTGHLSDLAAVAELDVASLEDRGGKLRGTFVIPGSEMRIAFRVERDGYTLESNYRLDDPAHDDPLAYHLSVALQTEDGVTSAGHGVVQFLPQDGQTFFEDGPVGYLYDLGARDSSFRALHGEVRDDGDYWIDVPPPEANRSLEASALGAMDPWLARLREAERLRPAR